MLPIQGPPEAAATLPTPPTGDSSSSTFRSQLAAREAALCGDSLPSRPPQAVLDQIGAARGIYHELRADGHQLHFSTDRRSGRATVEVKDRDGKIVRTVSAEEAMDIAVGKPLE
ncbi:MAG TPA: hypothetical protein VID48_01210 [Solirubrobacteraceae bacterium]